MRCSGRRLRREDGSRRCSGRHTYPVRPCVLYHILVCPRLVVGALECGPITGTAAWGVIAEGVGGTEARSQSLKRSGSGSSNLEKLIRCCPKLHSVTCGLPLLLISPGAGSKHLYHGVFTMCLPVIVPDWETGSSAAQCCEGCCCAGVIDREPSVSNQPDHDRFFPQSPARSVHLARWRKAV